MEPGQIIEVEEVGVWTNYKIHHRLSLPTVSGVNRHFFQYQNFSDQAMLASLSDLVSEGPSAPKHQEQCKGCGARKWLPDGRCAYCKNG